MGNKHKSSKNINFPNNNDIIKEQYFSYFSQSFIKHQYSIYNDSLNNKIAFIKNFKNSNNSKNKLRLNTNWKAYLLNFFEKQIAKKHEFYQDIINDIKDEKFGYENKYLSFMFYIDYENTYNNKNHVNIFKNYINEEELDYEKELKNRLSRNSSVDLTSSAFKKNKSIIGLPNLDNGGEIELNEQNQNQSFEKRKLRREITYLVKLIKSQIDKKDHPINIVISIFEKHISALIEDLLKLYKSSEEEKQEFLNNLEKYNSTIVNNILKFTSKIYIATKLFYSRVLHLVSFFEEKDELINIIMGILFNTGSLYHKIYYLFHIQYQKEIEDFKYNLKAIQNLKPKDIQIDDKFCLDENTDRIIKELRTQFYKDNNNANINEDIPIFTSLFDKSGNISRYKKEKFDGYNSAIEIIKTKLPKIKSPYKKMMLIASVSTEITECIDNYWAGTDEFIPSSDYLQVTSDDLLKIFIYIVVHAQLPELIIHEKIVQSFTFSYTKSSMIGYYASTLDAAITYIQKNLLNDVKIGITEEFRASIMDTLKINNTIKKEKDMPMEEDKLYDSIDEDFVLFEGIGTYFNKQKNVNYNDYDFSKTFNEKNSKNTKVKMFDFCKGKK